MSLFKEPEFPLLPWMRLAPRPRIWELSDILFHLESRTGKDPVYLSDVLRGVQVFGANGSGKTSGIGAALSLAYLKAGFGGLVLCVKKDEAELWEERCKLAGRSDDLVVVRAGSNLSYNVIEGAYAKASGDAGLSAATKLLIDISKLTSRGTSSHQDSFWDDQLRDLITEVLYLARRMHGTVNARNIIQILSSAQHYSNSDSSTSALNRHDFEERLLRQKVEYPNDKRLSDSMYYFLTTFKEIPEKTRATIVSMFMSVMKPLTLAPLEELFCSDTTITPQDTFEGKIIVVDVSVHEFHEVGQLCQIIWKTVFLNSVMERMSPNRPVFLWADESQYFAEEKDVLVNTTARSLRCSINYLTQNLPNYIAQIGKRDVVDAIIGSLIFKVFHQNTEPRTNQWASEAIGKIRVRKTTVSSKSNPASLFNFHLNQNFTTTEELQFDVEPRAFTNLKEGGFMNKGHIEGILHLPRKMSSGRTWVVAEFRQ